MESQQKLQMDTSAWSILCGSAYASILVSVTALALKRLHAIDPDLRRFYPRIPCLIFRRCFSAEYETNDEIVIHCLIVLRMDVILDYRSDWRAILSPPFLQGKPWRTLRTTGLEVTRKCNTELPEMCSRALTFLFWEIYVGHGSCNDQVYHPRLICCKWIFKIRKHW